MPTSGIVIHYVEWGQSPNPQDIHCFKGNSVSICANFFRNVPQALNETCMYTIICDTALHWNFAYTVKSFIHMYMLFLFLGWNLLSVQEMNSDWVGCKVLCEILTQTTTVQSTWCNNETFHLSMCCIPNKRWLVMFKKKNVWCMTSLSENMKPVKSVKTLMTDEFWKAIINRHLQGSRNI